MTKEHLVVLGAGPGGYTAAFYAADQGYKVTLFVVLGLFVAPSPPAMRCASTSFLCGSSVPNVYFLTRQRNLPLGEKLELETYLLCPTQPLLISNLWLTLSVPIFNSVVEPSFVPTNRVGGVGLAILPE